MGVVHSGTSSKTAFGQGGKGCVQCNDTPILSCFTLQGSFLEAGCGDCSMVVLARVSSGWLYIHKTSDMLFLQSRHWMEGQHTV